MLDQRIAGERADDIDALLGALERRRQFGIGLAILAGKFNPAFLDKFARRRAAHARDDPVAFYCFLPIAGFQNQLAILDLGRRGLVADHHLALLTRFHQQLHIGFLGPGKFRRAVENGDDIILRRIGSQAERILDARVARADHRDMLVIIFAGIVELILDQLVVAAGAAHQVRIALRTDRHHDRFGLHRLAILQGDGEIAFVTLDLHRLGIVHHVDAMARGLRVPGFENRLALAGVEIHVRAQHQLARRGHDMLALLIFVDGVGKMVGFLEQHMLELQLRCAPGGAHARWSGPDNDYTKLVRHAPASPHCFPGQRTLIRFPDPVQHMPGCSATQKIELWQDLTKMALHCQCKISHVSGRLSGSKALRIPVRAYHDMKQLEEYPWRNPLLR